jgi:NSS family neurotransmitter:Na+ symporter
MVAKRDRWAGNTVFILASIGSAIGLGNVWRFPHLCYKHGGGAFLVAYVFALLTAGIPLLILEFGLGNMTQRGAPGAFHKVRKWLEPMGWWAILVGFAVVCYYVVIMGWCVDYLCYAFEGSWGADTKSFFFKEFLALSEGPYQLGSFRWPIFLGMLVSWVLIVACIWKGATTVGKVVWITVLVPWLILIVFVVRGVTLPGAMQGLKVYLLPEWKKLLDPGLWVAAYGQVFYSLSVGFGIMIAYASFLPKRSNLVRDALLIATGDAMTAIVGGFAVFGALGNMAVNEGKAVTEVVTKSLSLAFVAYPKIINTLPGGSWVAPLFGVLFFLMLITLAVDSAFSLTEAVCAGIREKWGLSHMTANFTVAGLGMLLGLIFCFGSGLYWLDIVDHWIEFYGISMVCLVELVLLMAFLKAKRVREYINVASKPQLGPWWDICLLVVTPITLGTVIVWETVRLARDGYEGYPKSALIIGGWTVVLALPLVGIIVTMVRGQGDRDPELGEDASHDLDDDPGDGPRLAPEGAAPGAQPPAES